MKSKRILSFIFAVLTVACTLSVYSSAVKINTDTTLYGDCNYDGTVDVNDLTMLAKFLANVSVAGFNPAAPTRTEAETLT